MTQNILKWEFIKEKERLLFLLRNLIAFNFFSTMSTCLNSMTGVIFEDFIRPRLKKRISEARASFYMKLIVVVIGTFTVVLASIVDKLGGIIQVSVLAEPF